MLASLFAADTSNSTPLLLALVLGAITTVGVVVGPLLLSRMQGNQRARERQEDWARQDQLAAVAAEATQKVADRAQEIADKVTESAAHSSVKLEQIHLLVNGEMTAARQAELDQTRTTLKALERVIALDNEAGRPSSKDDLEAVETTRARIAELEAIVADRLRQQRIVDEQQKTLGSGNPGSQETT